MLFENKQLDSSDLPKVEDLKFIPLEKKYLKVVLISGVIFWVFVFIGTGIFYIYKGDEIPEIIKFTIPFVILLLFITSLILIVKGFHRKAYALRQKDIIFKTGLIWQKEISLPFNRVQHCEVSQGPIDRLFNLSNLHVFTAGGSGSDLSIPGLDPLSANELKEYIVKKSVSDEEE